MKVMARRIRPAYMECIHNRKLSAIWDKDDIVFVLDTPKIMELAQINKHAKEFVVYSPKFEFEVPYIAYEDDWEIFEEF